jgi:hypothetical protein
LFTLNSYSNPFIGSWQLVSGEYVNDKNELVDYAEADLHSIKVLSTTHYSFISMSGEKFWAAGAGSYQFDDKSYTENPIHASYSLAHGSLYVFQYKMNEAYWHNSRWEDGKRVEYEVWRKLK